MLKLLFVLILLACAPFAFMLSAIEPQPLVAVQKAGDARDAARTKGVVLRVKRALGAPEGKRRFQVSEKDLNSMLTFATQRFSFIRGRAKIENGLAIASLTADLSKTPVKKVVDGDWLNISVSVAPSSNGFELSAARFGPYDLPVSLVLPVVSWAIDRFIDAENSQLVAKAINSVGIQDKVVMLDLGISNADTKKLLAGGKKSLSEMVSLGDPKPVRDYYVALDAAVRDRRIDPRGSFVGFVKTAFEMAQKRTLEKPSGTDVEPSAVTENTTAILALGLYCGHWRVEQLIGEVRTGELENHRPRCGSTLSGRQDLRQHFIISAVLDTANAADLAFAIGEFKELLDSNQGGSGFSFVDLAADRAGIRFAQAALAGESAARAFQDRVANMARETEIFPERNDLVEGLTSSTFENEYKSTDSAAYKDLVATIDQRIDALALYN